MSDIRLTEADGGILKNILSTLTEGQRIHLVNNVLSVDETVAVAQAIAGEHIIDIYQYDADIAKRTVQVLTDIKAKVEEIKFSNNPGQETPLNTLYIAFKIVVLYLFEGITDIDLSDEKFTKLASSAKIIHEKFALIDTLKVTLSNMRHAEKEDEFTDENEIEPRRLLADNADIGADLEQIYADSSHPPVDSMPEKEAVPAKLLANIADKEADIEQKIAVLQANIDRLMIDVLDYNDLYELGAMSISR
jgi:hypothetical protein